MKTISSELKSHIASSATTTAICYKLTLKDSTVMGFASLDKDIEYNGVTYVAEAGFNMEKMLFNSNFKTRDSEIKSVLNSDYINESDLLTGKYDNAEVEMFLVNYEDLTMGKLILFRGFFGKITYKDGQFFTELKNLKSKLDTTIGNFYTPTCRARFCDGRCGLTESTYTFSGTVSAVSNQSQFYCDTADVKNKTSGYFNYGYLAFTSGNNNGRSIEVKRFNNGNITLAIEADFAISTGDSFNIVAGCDKKFTTCQGFSNVANFRGEPHIPGMDYLLQSK